MTINQINSAFYALYEIKVHMNDLNVIMITSTTS